MDNYVGDIIIGTKIDNKGLEKDLKTTKKIVEDFDKDNKAERKITAKELLKDEEVEVNPKIEFDNKDIDSAFLKMQMAIDKKSLKVNTLQNKIDAEKYNVNYYENEIEIWQKKYENLLKDYNEYKEIEALSNQGKNLTMSQGRKLMEGDILNIEKNFAEANQEFEKLISNQAKSVDKIDELNQQLKIAKLEYQELVQKAEELKNKSNENNIENVTNGLGNIKQKLNDVGKKTDNVISKIGKWALAIFSIRSAYVFIRQSVSTLSQYNDELATKLSNIRLVLAVGLEGVINRIINAVITLLSYLNYVMKSWFGIDIFARAAELTTQKMANNMSGAAGSAKEIKKQLAGFDEMNVLSDNSSSGVGGGAGASSTPAFNLEEQPVAKWFKDLTKWIKENYEWLLLIAGVLEGINLLIKAGNFVATAKNAASVLGGLATPFGILLGSIANTSLAIAGIILYFDGLNTAIENEDASINGLIKSFAELYGGSKILTYALGFLLGPIGLLGMVIMEITGYTKILGITLTNSEATVTNLAKAEKNLKAAEDERLESIDKLNTAQNEYNNTINSYDNAVQKAKASEEELNRVQLETGLSGEQLFNSVKNGELSYLSMNETQQKVYKAYMDNVDAQNNLNDITEKLTDNEKTLQTATDNVEKSEEKLKKKQFELSLATQLASGDFDGFKKSIIDAMNNGEISTDEASKYISQAMANMSDEGRKVFAEDLPNNVKKGLDPSKYETKSQKLKNWFSGVKDDIANLFSNMGTKIGEFFSNSLKNAVNSVLGWIEKQLNKPINAINSLINTINKIPGINIGRINTISLPRLASGAIINQPGRGVPVGGAIAGEAGREGILPLTDERAMSLLGREIGKWITVNANVPVSIGNRQIARIVKQLIAEDDFAMNN